MKAHHWAAVAAVESGVICGLLLVQSEVSVHDQVRSVVTGVACVAAALLTLAAMAAIVDGVQYWWNRVPARTDMRDAPAAASAPLWPEGHNDPQEWHVAEPKARFQRAWQFPSDVAAADGTFPSAAMHPATTFHVGAAPVTQEMPAVEAEPERILAWPSASATDDTQIIKVDLFGVWK